MGTISGMDLVKNCKGKVNKSQPIVHSGTGYRKSIQIIFSYRKLII